MHKYSKSDQPQTPEAAAAEREALAALQAKRSEHFTVGTRIIMNNRKGLIEAELVCKCARAERGLQILWDDDQTRSVIRPHALNPQGLAH